MANGRASRGSEKTGVVAAMPTYYFDYPRVRSRDETKRFKAWERFYIGQGVGVFRAADLARRKSRLPSKPCPPG